MTLLSCDRRSVGLGVGIPSGTHDQFFLFWLLWVSWWWALSLTRGWSCNYKDCVKWIYDRRSLVQTLLFSGSHLKPMTRFLFSVWQLLVPWCMALSMMREWICNLLVQLLLGLARAVSLWSKSRRTHDPILLFHMRLPQPWGPSPRTYIPQERGGPVIPSGIGFTFRRLLRLTGLRLRYSKRPPLFTEQCSIYVHTDRYPGNESNYFRIVALTITKTLFTGRYSIYARTIRYRGNYR
jgi:hypothetical protein